MSQKRLQAGRSPHLEDRLGYPARSRPACLEQPEPVSKIPERTTWMAKPDLPLPMIPLPEPSRVPRPTGPARYFSGLLLRAGERAGQGLYSRSACFLTAVLCPSANGLLGTVPLPRTRSQHPRASQHVPCPTMPAFTVLGIEPAASWTHSTQGAHRRNL